MILRDTIKSQLPLMGLALGAAMLAYWPVGRGMVSDWIYDENYSHGFVVVLVSAYLIWQRRETLLSQTVQPSLWGLAIALAGTGMLLTGWIASELFTMRFSLLVVLSGAMIFWFGWRVMAVLAGPVAYLILMIPIPATVYDALAFPLKLFVTKASVAVLKAIGVMVVRDGNIMMFPNITLEVVNACSGLRSLTSLLALGLAYVMLFVKENWQKYIIIALIFPVAIAANMIRVIGTGLLAQYYGAAAAEGFFHEFAGLVIFMSSLAILLGVHQLLSRWSK